METPQAIEASCKLAFELGQQQALRDYMLLTKEAAWGELASKTWGGLKALGGGQKFTLGSEGATFGQLAGEAGQAMKKPWEQLYQRYRGGRYRDAVAREEQHAADLDRYISGGRKGTAPIAPSATAPTPRGYGLPQDVNVSKYTRPTAEKLNPNYQGYWDIINQNKANLAAGGVAAGAGIYGTRALLGGGDTYNIQPVQPQVAPHQYYMNQMSNWWK